MVNGTITLIYTQSSPLIPPVWRWFLFFLTSFSFVLYFYTIAIIIPLRINMQRKSVMRTLLTSLICFKFALTVAASSLPMTFPSSRCVWSTFLSRLVGSSYPGSTDVWYNLCISGRVIFPRPTRSPNSDDSNWAIPPWHGTRVQDSDRHPDQPTDSAACKLRAMHPKRVVDCAMRGIKKTSARAIGRGLLAR